MKKVLIFGVVALLVLLGIFGMRWFGGNFAGGGGVEQTVQESVKAGGSAEVVAKFSVWGGGGKASERYKEVYLSYMVTGEDLLGQAEPKMLSEDEKSITYSFQIPTEKYFKGEISYTLQFDFDNRTRSVEGVKKIRITD